MRLQPTAQVGQRAALTDEVVYYHINLTFDDVAAEGRLPSKASISIGTCMRDDVDLNDVRIEAQCQPLAQEPRKCRRNRIEAVVFVCMGAGDSERPPSPNGVQQASYGC